MDLANLNSRYANRAENFVFALQAGRVLKKSHAELHGDVMAAVELLRRWGVKPGFGPATATNGWCMIWPC